MDIPTDADWADWPDAAIRPLDLDEQYARDKFAGKSFEEAVQMFEENVLTRSEDVSYMPPVPFRYYMLAFKAWVLLVVEKAEDVFSDAPDAASSFLRLIELMLEHAPDSIGPIMPELLPAVDFVEANQERYDADKDIYGDFRERAQRIRERWAAHRQRRA
jgi:hypothetical protein